MEGFLKKIENSPYEVKYLTPLTTNEWGQRVVRIFDLDGHLIEVRDIV